MDLTWVTLTMAGVVSAALAALHLKKPTVPKPGTWEDKPRLIVIEGCGLTLDDARKAAKWWRKRGQTIGKPEWLNVSNYRGGSDGHVKGSIVFDVQVQNSNPNHVGTTSRKQDGSKIVSAVCRASWSSLGRLEKERVVAHELGHALGFEHVETKVLGMTARKSGHIMHPDSDKVGWGSKGL